MIKKIIPVMCFLFVFTCITGTVCARTIQSDPAEGFWKSIDDKTGNTTGIWKLYIASDDRLYGELVWIPDVDPRALAATCTKVSSYDDIPFSGNPAERTVLNTPWLYKVQYVSPGVWKQGHIIDPTDGNHYYGGITYDNGKLKMRGSLDKRGWFGRSQVWEPVSPEEVEQLIADAAARFGIN